MFPLLGMGIGAGLGLLKSEISDKPRYEAKKRLAAETTRWSPWTGMVGQMPEAPDAFGSALQFGGAGAGLQQGIAGASASEALNKKYLDILGGSPSTQVPIGMGPVASGADYGAALESQLPSGVGPVASGSDYASMLGSPRQRSFSMAGGFGGRRMI